MIQNYQCGEPFSSYLKKQFAKDRRKGSRDRKLISDLCYRYFRIGVLFEGKTAEEKLIYALFLTSQKQDEFHNLLSERKSTRLNSSH